MLVRSLVKVDDPAGHISNLLYAGSDIRKVLKSAARNGCGLSNVGSWKGRKKRRRCPRGLVQPFVDFDPIL